MREALEARSGLSPEQIDTLCAFGQALIEKNKVMNLTAITEPQAVAELHFLDCIALLRAEDFSGKRVIDIGCGAGFPGVPLKIAEPSIELTLLDSLAKRMTWLREILPQLGVEAEVVTARAEEFVQTRREQYDIATSRAVARLNILAELCLPYVKVGGAFLAMKGALAGEEMEEAKRVVALLGGKTPHIQNLAVGGVANPINLDGLGVLNLERLMYIKSFIDKLSDFVEQVYKVDTAVIAAFYPEWLTRGKGAVNYLSVPEFPTDSKNGSFLFPGGYIENADLSSYRPITSHSDEYLIKGIQESAKHSWYKDEAPQAPWEGTTIPAYDGWSDDGKYSWVKSPTFYGKTVEVGPLANMLVKLAAGRESTQNKLNEIVAIYQKLTGNTLEVAQLHSTLGRIIGRTVHCCELQDILQNQYSALITNIGKGDHTTFVKPNIPATGEFKGVGFLEAPRGMLSHWMVIKLSLIHI